MRLKKKVKKTLFAFLILILLIGLSYACYFLLFNKNDKKEDNKLNKSTTKKVTTTTIKKESNELSMVMIGDVLIHRFVYTDADNGDGTYSFSKMFTEMEPLIKGNDLAYYNQESIIGGKSLGLSAYPRFNSPEEIGEDMVKLGFNMVSLANNHTMDKDSKGVENSVNFWRTQQGVYWTGSALSEEERENNIRIQEKNGIKYVLLSYTTVTNGLNPPAGKEYMTNIYSEEKVKADLAKVRDKVDFIIVAMHWGEEYTTYPSVGQKAIAQFLSSQGVNLIIGNHPHSIQPVEMIGDTLVFYALGNFIAAQDTIDRQTGTTINMKVHKSDDGKITFSDIKATLTYAYFKNTLPRDFKVYPYSKLDSSLLSSHDTYFNKYKEVLTRYTDVLEVR